MPKKEAGCEMGIIGWSGPSGKSRAEPGS